MKKSATILKFLEDSTLYQLKTRLLSMDKELELLVLSIYSISLEACMRRNHIPSPRWRSAF
jgi:hypothetical protein